MAWRAMNARRRALSLSLVSTLFGCSQLASRSGDQAAHEVSLDRAYLDALFEADAEPESFLRVPREVPRWRDLVSKPEVRWASDSTSADFSHLRESIGLKPFAITSQLLATICLANHFDVLKDTENVLFGLRGASLESNRPFEEFAEQVYVREAIPDHANLKCVIGVWRPRTSQVWAANGSTVPNVDYMYQCMNGGKNANLLPTGLYYYQVGAHNRGLPQVSQPGALRQTRAVCVLRSRDNMCFELPTDSWDLSAGVIVGDNIHAGVLDTAPSPPRFSSAGCQTLPGTYDATRRVPLGVWAEFRVAAGLARMPVFEEASTTRTNDDGRTFSYVLLTGRDLRIAGTPVQYGSRLRYGSTGAVVGALQSKLGIVATNRFDQRTMIRWLRYQGDRGLVPDGIVSSEEAARIGVA